ncbi:MAG: ACP S-malonyltransferase [Candidatus Polarisedimenticolia bacterium]
MIAFVFPGQGSQEPGMGRSLLEAFAACRETFQEADDTLGFPLTRLCLEGPAEELQLTANAQPAILTVSVAASRALEEAGLRPEAVAGHSLGEYSALVAAGALTLADALRLVRRRGQYMQEAVPVGEGAMAALMGLERDVVDQVCREARAAAGDRSVVSPANLNAPGQVVISGHAGAVDTAIALAKERGAQRAIRLAVSAPFHCILMQPAADRLAQDLAATPFSDLRIPLVANVTAAPLASGAQARAALEAQVTAPVRWDESVKALAALGVSRAVEAGPGRVLTGLIKRIDAGFRCVPAGDADSVTKAVEAL